MNASAARPGINGTANMAQAGPTTPYGRGVRRPRPIKMMLCIFAVLVPALAACGGAGPGTPAPQAADTEYKVGPGDKLRVMVFGQPDMSGEYQVDGAGNIAFPLIGGVEAGGKSAPELETTMQDQLSQYLREPDVSIEVLNFRPFYVVGEVREPGDYPYKDDISVMNAVAIAGGFTYRARKESFTIQRKSGGQTQEFEATPGSQVLPGDVVIVRERFF